MRVKRFRWDAPHLSSGLRETPDATFPQGKAGRRGGDEGTLSGRTQRHAPMVSPGGRPDDHSYPSRPQALASPQGKLSAKLTDEGKAVPLGSPSSVIRLARDAGCHLAPGEGRPHGGEYPGTNGPDPRFLWNPHKRRGIGGEIFIVDASGKICYNPDLSE